MHNERDTSLSLRNPLAKTKRIVIKVGTNILVNKNGKPNKTRIDNLCQSIANLKKQGYQVILVSSGAIGAGLHALKLKTRPTELAQLQMAAAVGQTCLLEEYGQRFKKHKLPISQVLLTHDDLRHRQRHLNARNTLHALLENGILPIVNENDVVAVDEIKVGDNDVLSALVTVLLDADALILLTTPNGLRKPLAHGKTTRVPYLETITEESLALATGKTNPLSTGGMATKLLAAQTAAKIGALVIIASGTTSNTLEKIMSGKDIGTIIGNPLQASRKSPSRKRWLSYFHRCQGNLWVDDGAQMALRSQGKSLLPVGITKIHGKFPSGAMINILNQHNETIGQGLVEYSSEIIAKIKGKKSREIKAIIENYHNDVVIHRNNLVITH